MDDGNAYEKRSETTLGSGRRGMKVHCGAQNGLTGGTEREDFGEQFSKSEVGTT